MIVAIAACVGYAPHVGHVGGVNSDNAIPLLMANHDGTTPFDLFYWGQDRFGAWTFLVARELRWLTGIGWTQDGLFWWMVVLTGSSLWPLRWMAGRAGTALAAGVILASFHARIFEDTGQPYGWQLGPLLWAWWSILQLIGASATVRPTARAPLLATLGWSLLSIWLSPMSLLFLLLFASMEFASIRSRRRHWRDILPVGSALGGALAIAVLIQLGHGWYARAHNLWYQVTVMALDRGHLWENLRKTGEAFQHAADMRLCALAVLLALLALWRLRRLSGERATCARMALVLLAAAAANFVAVALVSWTRLNDYHPRYLFFASFLAEFSLVASLLALLPRTVPGFKGAHRWEALLLTVGIALVTPHRGPPENLSDLQRACAELPARAPGAVLLGSYWGTYLFVDGTATHPLMPVTEEMDFTRTPASFPLLKTADPIIVSLFSDERFQTPTGPVPFIQENDSLLELEQADWLRSGPYAFARYRNRTSDIIAGVTATALGKTIDAPCRTFACLPLGPDTAALRVEFPPRDEGEVVLFFGATHQPQWSLPTFKVEALGESPGAAAPSIEVASQPPVVVIRFRGTGLHGLSLSAVGAASGDAPVLRSVELLSAARRR